MSTKKGRYGINVKKWCLDHENDLRVMTEGALSDDDRCRILALHEKKLSWLMHERLVHLIVTFITVILVLFAMSLILFLPDTLPFSLPLFLILLVLLFFYIRHYFFLENTVQNWYLLYEEIKGL
ncbi:MAG: hypothetical protein K6F28_01925 [Lachnospiraceae bacterium]|nr:hypothetical protein [Lachnospiraceae bacterium]